VPPDSRPERLPISPTEPNRPEAAPVTWLDTFARRVGQQTRRKHSSCARRFRPAVEPLEVRDVPAALLPASICGYVYEDFSSNPATYNNGIFDAGENPIPGTTVTLNGQDFFGSAVSLSTKTDSTGHYCFLNLVPGTYTINEVQPAGYVDGKDTQGTPGTGTTGNDVFSSVFLDSGVHGDNNNFGELPLAVSPGSLSGTVYCDCDDNGVLSGGDLGIKGVVLTLSGPGGTRTATTDASGNYSFTNLDAGTYSITESQPAGFNQGTNTIGTLGGVVNGDAITGIVVGGNNGTGYNFGETETPAAVTLKLTKTADKSTYAPGDTITYTYVVTNTSQLPMSNVVVTDDNATPGMTSDDFTVGTVASLASGASQTFTATRTAPTPSATIPRPIFSGSTLVGYMYTDILPSGDVRATFVESRSINDNVYGTSATPATGWSKGHKYSDLVGSDHAQFLFDDANGQNVLQFNLDYISQATSTTFGGGTTVSYPSGYGTLGVNGGDGGMTYGSSANVLSATTSLTQDVNNPLFVSSAFRTNSPVEPNANWVYDITYSVVVGKAAFGAAGFGGWRITAVHNSPPKTGNGALSPTPGPASETLTNVATATGTACGTQATATASATVTVTTPTPPSPLQHGDTATIGFWHNKNGQALILSLNGGPTSTGLANWLASNFPFHYGNHSANNLTGKTNEDVAALFQKFFSVTGMKTDAQILGAALAVYVTDSDLAGTAAAKYGFNVSTTGTGAKTYNVGSYGTAIGLKSNTSYTILFLLQQADLDKKNGTFDANAFNAIFDGINQLGDIT
jgi:hypothetical protein